MSLALWMLITCTVFFSAIVAAEYLDRKSVGK